MFLPFQVNKDKTIHFNVDVTAGKSLKDFIAHEKHHGISEPQMKEIWELCMKKAGKPIPVEKAEQPKGEKFIDKFRDKEKG